MRSTVDAPRVLQTLHEPQVEVVDLGGITSVGGHVAEGRDDELGVAGGLEPGMGVGQVVQVPGQPAVMDHPARVRVPPVRPRAVPRSSTTD